MHSHHDELQTNYKSRLNEVFKYIDENPGAELSLAELSKIACFSPYHFHRIFKSITGERLKEYVTRQKIEKSALDLMHSSERVADLAIKYGFAEQSSFSRAFKKFFGVSATEFKKQNQHKFSKIRQLKSKIGQTYPGYEDYLCTIDKIKNWITMNAKIEVRELPEMNLAYVTCIGPQNLEAAFQVLIRWATPRGLMQGKTKMISLYHDSFKVTEESKVRMSAGMVLTESVEVEGEIGLTTIFKGKFVIGSYEIGLEEFDKAWSGLFIWMHEQGYKKGTGDPFEIYHNNFNEHPQKKAIVDFCIPVD